MRLLWKRSLVRLPPGGEVAKAGGLRIDRALEAADGDFVVVAGVDHRHIRRRNQGVPVGGIDVVAGARGRVHIRLAHGHDLLLEPYLHAGEGALRRARTFPVEICAAGQGADMFQHSRDPRLGSGDRAVDPLGRQQQRARHPVGEAGIAQRRLMRGGLRKAGEVIEGGDGEHGGDVRPPRCRIKRAVPRDLEPAGVAP